MPWSAGIQCRNHRLSYRRLTLGAAACGHVRRCRFVLCRRTCKAIAKLRWHGFAVEVSLLRCDLVAFLTSPRAALIAARTTKLTAGGSGENEAVEISSSFDRRETYQLFHLGELKLCSLLVAREILIERYGWVIRAVVRRFKDERTAVRFQPQRLASRLRYQVDDRRTSSERALPMYYCRYKAIIRTITFH
jgi:hypothetical protein